MLTKSHTTNVKEWGKRSWLLYSKVASDIWESCMMYMVGYNILTTELSF